MGYAYTYRNEENMKARILVDNIGFDGMKGEWGLSIYIEADDKKILLDTGASPLFIQNAEKMGLALADVDYAVLSHAHYDHADGMRPFFGVNSKAKFYLRKPTGENCYFKKWFVRKYVGIPRNILQDYSDRIVQVEGKYKLCDRVYLIPHDTPELEKVGRANHMYVKNGRRWMPDDFSHEQSLVFDTDKGLVVFNSCCHGGADNIINEAARAFDKPVAMLVGGFHIFGKSREEVTTLARRIRETGVKEVYTGHCTGAKSFGVLKEELGDMVKQLKVGLTIEF